MSFESSVRASAAAFLAVALTACAGAGSSDGAPPIPHCEAISGPIDPQAVLVAPAKGATGVPLSVGSVSFTVSDPALRQGATLMLISNGIDYTTTQITNANGTMSAPLPPLKGNTSVSVSVSAPLPPERQTECGKQVTGYLGSFTTQ